MGRSLIWDRKIPFDKNGNMLGYGSYGVHEWRDNYEFDASLKFTYAGRGRSAVKFHFEDEFGKQYEMFLQDLSDIIANSIIDKGSISGRLTFCKKGENFGIKKI